MCRIWSAIQRHRDGQMSSHWHAARPGYVPSHEATPLLPPSPDSQSLARSLARCTIVWPTYHLLINIAYCYVLYTCIGFYLVVYFTAFIGMWPKYQFSQFVSWYFEGQQLLKTTIIVKYYITCNGLVMYDFHYYKVISIGFNHSSFQHDRKHE